MKIVGYLVVEVEKGWNNHYAAKNVRWRQSKPDTLKRGEIAIKQTLIVSDDYIAPRIPEIEVEVQGSGGGTVTVAKSEAHLLDVQEDEEGIE